MIPRMDLEVIPKPITRTLLSLHLSNITQNFHRNIQRIFIYEILDHSDQVWFRVEQFISCHLRITAIGMRSHDFAVLSIFSIYC